MPHTQNTIDQGRCLFCDHEKHRDPCLAHRVFSTELCDCESYVPRSVFFPNGEHQVDQDDDQA